MQKLKKMIEDRGFMILKIDLSQLDKIIDIEKESFNKPWTKSSYEELCNSYNSEIYVYKNENEIVAYAVILDMVDVYELVRIAVKKEYRGQKYGKTLLKEIINFKEKNIYLEVRENNQAAIKLYENTGFKIVNIRKKYYKDTGENALVMLYDI